MLTGLEKIMLRVGALQAWAAQYPEVSAAWDEALDEKEIRDAEAGRRRCEAAMLAQAAQELTTMGVCADVAGRLAAELRAPEAERRHWNTPAMDAARTFLARPPRDASTLVLLGGCGSGKSSAAAWCLFRGARARVYEDWNQMLDAHRGLCATAAELARLPLYDDEGRWERALYVPWLVVDDLGLETMTDHWLGRFGELFSARHGNHRRTVYTANLWLSGTGDPAKSLRARYGERVLSRLHEHSVVQAVGSQDHRSAGAPA